MGLQQTVDKWMSHSKNLAGVGGSGGHSPFSATPFAEADFMTETYSGAVSSLGDILEDDATWSGTFTGIIDENGLTISSEQNPIVANALMADLLVGEGFTIVFEILTNDAITGSLGVDFYDDPGFVSEWSIESNVDYTVAGPTGITLANTIKVDVIQRLAVSFSSTEFAVALNGVEYKNGAPDDFAIAKDHLGTFGSCFIRNMKVYDYVLSNVEMLSITAV